ncbi:type II and III secretion system protein [Novispirillum sp. DQ9]|uniref:type II and III secretion system protein n=1 Tax=Novispirillum sp. DQ9 TaxID=3398612 RepID=UPI003C7ED70C
MLAGCASYDRNAGLERADYENLMSRRGPEQARPAAEPPIPDLQPILAAPTPPELADQRRVSVQVTQATSVRDLLIELARKAEVDLDLDPRIEGGIILQARERPFEEVVRRIADLAGLRYTFADNVLRVELDEPYMQHYRVDLLNLIRTTNTRVEASTDVFNAISNSGSSSVANGSNTAIEGQSVNDFWKEVQTGIEAIVKEAPPPARLVTGASPTGDTTPPQPQAQSQAQAPAPEGAEGATAQASAIAGQTAAAATREATPAAPASGAAAPAGDTAAETDDVQYFTINRPAGIITVQTTQAKHRRITEYLDQLRTALQAQVLIEAKVVEVALADQFRAGIDWSYVNLPQVALTTALAGNNLILPPGRTAPTLAAGVRSDGGALTGLLNLLDTFGTSRTLSSPRLTVVNNETALLKVAENEVYFTIEVNTTTSENGPPITTYSSTLNTVPIGMLMQVQPSINLKTNQISLSLRPTISRVVGRVQDPAVSLVNTAVISTVPIVEVREIDSVVTMESGSVLVMGGLMQERSANQDEKVPVLGDVPVAGNLFKRQNRDNTMTELVIFLRATIVQGRDSVHQADVDLYNTYTPDPRPIGF